MTALKVVYTCMYNLNSLTHPSIFRIFEHVWVQKGLGQRPSLLIMDEYTHAHTHTRMNTINMCTIHKHRQFTTIGWFMFAFLIPLCK